MLVNTSIQPARLRDLMPPNYGEILRQRCGYKNRQLIYSVVNAEDEEHPIYEEALKLAAETKAKREAEKQEQQLLKAQLFAA